MYVLQLEVGYYLNYRMLRGRKNYLHPLFFCQSLIPYISLWSFKSNFRSRFELRTLDSWVFFILLIIGLLFGLFSMEKRNNSVIHKVTYVLTMHFDDFVSCYSFVVLCEHQMKRTVIMAYSSSVFNSRSITMAKLFPYHSTWRSWNGLIKHTRFYVVLKCLLKLNSTIYMGSILRHPIVSGNIHWLLDEMLLVKLAIQEILLLFSLLWNRRL